MPIQGPLIPAALIFGLFALGVVGVLSYAGRIRGFYKDLLKLGFTVLDDPAFLDEHLHSFDERYYARSAQLLEQGPYTLICFQLNEADSSDSDNQLGPHALLISDRLRLPRFRMHARAAARGPLGRMTDRLIDGKERKRLPRVEVPASAENGPDYMVYAADEASTVSLVSGLWGSLHEDCLATTVQGDGKLLLFGIDLTGGYIRPGRRIDRREMALLYLSQADLLFSLFRT